MLEDDDDDDDEEEEDNDGECLELEEDEEEEDLVESSDSLERDGSLAERRGSVELLLLLLPLLVVVIFLDSKDCAWDIKKKKIQECLYFYFFSFLAVFPIHCPKRVHVFGGKFLVLGRKAGSPDVALIIAVHF